MKKRLLFILLVLIMALSLVPAMSITAWAGETEETTATVGSYTVLLPEGVTLPSGAGSGTAVTEVKSTDTEWGESGQTKWYVATGDITIDHTVTVKGDVHLILADNCVLTVKPSSSGNAIVCNHDSLRSVYSTLSIFSCSVDKYVKGNGKLVVEASSGIAISGNNINIYGGDINLKCSGKNEKYCLYSDDGIINIYDGLINMTSEWLGILGYIINIKGGNIVSNAGFSFAADVNICDASVNVKDVIFSEIGSINIARSKVIIDSSEQALVCNSIKIDKNSLISAGDNSSNVKTICADRESTDNISSGV